MTRARIVTAIGVAVVIVAATASAWALGALMPHRPPEDLGPRIVVPTAAANTEAPATTAPEASPTSLPPSPTQSAPPTTPGNPAPTATHQPATARPSEAVKVSKPPAPQAGDEDDDDDDDDDHDDGDDD